MNINEKEIEQASRKIDLGGFNMNDELNPKIWDKDEKMRSDVKKTLLKIADDYFESLDLPGVDIEDVTMTGSLANYNWSKYSDVDLHIVVDYDDLPMDRELVQDFLKSKSSAWNKEHDVKIYGYDVELYVQDINEPHHSTGVYSVLNNEWNIKPEKKKISFSDKSVIDKANRLMDRIEDIYDDMGTDDNEDIIKRVDKLTEKIKKMRQSGLESGGEFSVENIVFKVLRRNGMLDRLYDIKTVAYDKSVTLESEDLDRLIESLDGDDFDWIRDVEVLPIPGTAWIMEINPEDSEEVQQRLFDVGFGWSNGGKKINETSGISAFVSYGGYDIKYNRFKMVIGDSYDSDFINYVIRQVQPNDLYFYQFSNGVSKLKDTDTLNESDELDWIRDTKPEPIIGSCIVDKLDPSQTMWTIESERKTLSGTDVIDISDGEKNLSLNKKFFLEDYYNGRYVFCNELINESDEMDWIRDTKPSLNMDSNWMLINDVDPNSYEESKLIQEFLFDLGYKWYSSKGVQQVKINDIQHFNSESLKGDLTYCSPNEKSMTECGMKNHENIYYWSEIKPNNLNESDDMDWIKNIDTSDYLEPPYFINMKNQGLSKKEYNSVLSKLYNQPVKYGLSIQGYSIYDDQNKKIYFETTDGQWVKRKFDEKGFEIYYENSDGSWQKREYDANGNQTYFENNNGLWIKSEYDDQNKRIYYEDSSGIIIDNRNLNESDDLDWIRDTGLPFRVGDVFHTRLDFTPKDLSAEVTFEIYDISPDTKWVRFKHHTGSMYKGTYIDIDKINSETISRGWDKRGYSRANSSESKQVIKNITTGFWKKVDVPGYLDLHPEKKDEIIQLGTNLNESDDFDWIREIVPDVYVGAKFKTPNGNIIVVYETDEFTTSYVVIDGNNGRKRKQRIITREFIAMTKERGLWEKIDDETPINESGLDDFEWIRDTGLPSEYGVDFKKGRHHIKVDGLTTDEKEKIQQIILNKGITWGDLDKNVKKGEYYADEGVYYYVVTNGFLLVGRGPSEEEGIKYIDGGLFLDYNKHTINESDDFDWVKNINPIPLEKNDFVSLNNLIWDYFDTNGLMTYDGWSYGIFNNGREITWTHPDFEDLIIMATPFSDDEYIMSIEFQEDFAHETIDTVKLPIFKHESELTDWLSNEYPQIVLETIEWGMGDYTDEIYLRNE